MVEPKKQEKMGRHCAKKYYFKVCIVDQSDYPDFKSNPTNPLTEMSEDYRMEDLVKTLGAVWAETVYSGTEKGID